MERAFTQTQLTAEDDMVDVQENSKSLHLLSLLSFYFYFLFLQRPPILLLHVLIDCSVRALGHPAQQSANPPMIITPQPSLTGTGKTWILFHYICVSVVMPSPVTTAASAYTAR